MSIPRRGLFSNGLKGACCSILYALLGKVSNAFAGEIDATLLVHPVGRVEREGDSVHLTILEEYRNALLGLDGYSHILVLYWFDRNDIAEKRRILRVHPQGNQDNPLTGVFACRAPVRPNLIGLTLCKVLSVAEGRICVDKIDALDGSPIVDIKPYIPSIDDTAEDIRLPDWLKR